MTAKERLVLAKKIYISGNSDIRSSISSLFPDTDFTIRDYNIGDTFTIKIKVEVDEVDPGDEHAYRLVSTEFFDDDESECGVMIDDGGIWVTDEFVQRYKV